MGKKAMDQITGKKLKNGARLNVSFSDAIRLWWRNWLNFKNGASRSEYWRVFLLIQPVGAVLAFLGIIILVAINDSATINNSDNLGAIGDIIIGSFIILSFIVTIAFSLIFILHSWTNIKNRVYGYRILQILCMVIGLIIAAMVVFLIMALSDVDNSLGYFLLIIGLEAVLLVMFLTKPWIASIALLYRRLYDALGNSGLARLVLLVPLLVASQLWAIFWISNPAFAIIFIVAYLMQLVILVLPSKQLRK